MGSDIFGNRRSRQGRNIVQLFATPTHPAIPALNQVEAYWHALRSGPALPRRSDINPRGLEQVLENVFLLERMAPGLARFRLSGSHLNTLLGMDARGMPFSSFFSAGSRRDIATALETVFDTPAIVRLSLRARTGIGRPPLTGHVILLPVLDDLGHPSRVLGCFSTKGKPGRAPRRFDLLEHSTRPALAPDPAADTQRDTPLTRHQFAEPPAPAFDTPDTDKPGTKRPHLRLVKTDP
jgi:hypothetical protein